MSPRPSVSRIVVCSLALSVFAVCLCGATEVNVSNAAGYQGAAAIAVDPGNSSRLLVAGRDGLLAAPAVYFSSDGGTSWTPATLPLAFPSHTYGEGYQPDVRSDAQGVWFAAYVVDDPVTGSPTDTTIAVARSYNGILWDALGTPLAQCCGGSTDPVLSEPALAVDTVGCGSYGGRLYVAWVRRSGTDRAIYLSHSTDGGVTWSAPVKVNDGATGTERVFTPRLAVDPNGVLYVAWLDDARKRIYVDRSTDGGYNFGTDRQAATVTLGCSGGDCGLDPGCSGSDLHGSTPALAVDTSASAQRGWVYLAFADDLGGGDGLDVFLTRSADGGSTWTSPGRVNADAAGTGRAQFAPGLSAALSDGSLHAAWYDRRDDASNCATHLYTARSADGGTTWGAEVRLTSTPTPTYAGSAGEGARVGVAVTDAGAWHAWTDARLGEFETYAGFVPSANGTRVSGTLATDTTWTLAAGPYYLTGDVTVETGVVLTIQPGVTVYAGPCDDRRAGWDSGRAELIVKGTLAAVGTVESPILFDGGGPSPGAGTWWGLRFESTANSGACQLTRVTLDHSASGISLNGASPVLDHVTIQNTTASGLSGTTNSTVSFSPVSLTLTATAGTALAMSGGSGGVWRDLRIAACPGGPGTLAGGTTLLRLVGAEVGNCGTLPDQGLTVTAPGGTVEIIRSSFHDNAGYGLRLAGEGPRTLSENEIYGNGGAGLVGANGSSGWPNIAAYYNNVRDNAGPEASMENGSIPLDGRRNWWGTTATAQMDTLGYPDNIGELNDIHDNGTLRHVDYDLWQAGPVSVAGGVESHLVLPTTLPQLQHRICGAAVAPEGILRVEVSVDGGATWENATVAGAAFYYDWFPTAGTYTVLSRATDRLGTVETVPDSVTVTVSTGITTSGTLLTDELWSGTVVLEGDVIVPSGLTLTVAPGTQIRAKALGDKTFSGLDPSRIELIVRGNLIATGTSGSRISFDSARLAPLPADWYGIRFLDTTTDALSGLTYADVYRGVHAVRLESAAPDLLHCRFRWNSLDGVSGNSGSLSKSLWKLHDVAATDNGSSGFRVTAQTAVEALDDVASTNGADGFYVDAAGYPVTVERLTAQGNGTAGVYVNAGSTGVVVRESTALGNVGAGISIGNGGAEARLERCTIQSNGGAGVSIGWASASTLVNNLVTLNARGLQVSNARVVAAYNTFSGNDDLDDQGSGFHYSATEGEPSVLGMNTFDDAAPLEVGFYGSRAVNARRNWWGTATTAAMVAAGFPAPLDKMRDIQDDRTLGLLDYSNWLPAAPGAVATRAAHVTSPATGVTLNRYNVVVTGVAYAQAGIDHVEVSTDGGSTWGVATGTEAWTYSWYPSPGTFGLQVKVVDGDLVSSTPDETVAVTITQGAPTTSGPILFDEVWGPGDVVLTGDVTVPSGVTLTLNAGTNVEATPLMDDRLGGLDRSRIELIVQGRLLGNGVVGGTPVALTSTRATPQAWDWSGLRYEDTADDAGNTLTHVHVTAAYDGIAFAGGTSPLTEVESSGHWRHGLYIYDPGSALYPGAVSVTGGTFSYNGGGGVQFSRGASDAVATTWTFDGSVVEHNGGGGIAGDWGDCQDSFVFEGLSVVQNAQAGIGVVAPWWCYANFPSTRLSGSVIAQNGGDGANLFGETTEVFGNQFTGQSTAGTAALKLTKALVVDLYKNTFSGNGANLRLESQVQSATCVYNDFGATTYLYSPGVFAASGSGGTVPRFNYDSFGDGASGTIFEAGPTYGANAWGSYWGVATTAEMTSNPFPADISTILDIEDEVWRGRVDYSRNLSAPPTLTAPRLSHFLNPEDGATLSGTTFLLQGAAGADAGIARVEVSTDGGTLWTTASGTAAWSHTWSPSTGGTHTLLCRVVDRNSVVQAPPTSITVTVNLVNVTTSGPLTVDENWSGVIVLTGDVTVPAGITLTLEPGTVVKATPNSDDRFGGVDTSRIELIIEGRLLATGTVSDPITLTTAAGTPAKAQWYGLRFTDTADSTVTLSYLQVSWGVKGISGAQKNAYPDLSHCTVDQMSEEGILLNPGYNASVAPVKAGHVLSDCTVQNCSSGIVVVYYNGSAPWQTFTFQLLRNTAVACSSGPGIEWHSYYSTVPAVTVSGNQVTGCAGGGLKIYTWNGCCTSTVGQLTMEDNTVINSAVGIDFGYLRVTRGVVRGNTVSGGAIGLSSNQYQTLRVEGNTFHGGSGAGVTFGHGQLLRNQIYGYGGDGLQLFSDAPSPDDAVLFNDIYDNGGRGLYFSYWCPTTIVNFNNITGSALASAFNDSPNGVDARLNWWGAAVTSEMDGKGYPANITQIWDIEDDGAKGRVDYGAWLSAPAATGVTLESRFVWPASGATLSRRGLTLRGAAYASAGIDHVEVSTDGGTTWSPAAGTYAWTFAFTPPTGGPYTFMSRTVAVGGAVESPGASVSVTVDADAPTTSGTLLHDETWSGIITLTGDVVVPAGMTLTLLPGAIVRCQPLADDTHGGLDTSRIELILEGRLAAVGTSVNPITLTSAAVSPAKGQWYGLRFTGTTDSTVTLTYLQVEYARRGISGFNMDAYPDLSHCTVRHMSEEGVLLYPGYNAPGAPVKAGLSIADCAVQNCSTGISVEFQNGNLSWQTFPFQFLRNTVSSCTTGPGIQWHSYYSLIPLVTASENLVDACPGGGIKIYTWNGCCSSTLDQLLMENNTITDSGVGIAFDYLRITRGVVRGNTVSGGSAGLSATQYQTIRVEGNAFHGGSGIGVRFSHGQLLRNQIYGYGGDGVQISDDLHSPDDAVLYNDIHDNGGRGVYVYSWGPNVAFHFNNITNNVQDAAYNEREFGVDARRNWWGAAMTSEMVAKGYPANILKIWDIEDDGARGRIDYSAWLSEAANTSVSLASRFVWPPAGASLSRSVHVLQGTAFATAGIDRVEVSLDGGATWVAASGTYSWTYEWTPSTPQPYTLRCRVVATGGAVEDPGDSVSVTVSETPTTSGTLSHNEVWSGTVTLTGDVVIPAGLTLTVSPGTQVRFTPWSDDRHGGIDPSRIEIITLGTLSAAGTSSARIGLTTASATPSKGQWYGLRYLRGASSNQSVSFCDLSWGVTAIGSTEDGNGGVYPDVSDCVIDQMSKYGIGIGAAGTSSKSLWSLRRNTISNTGWNGIRALTLYDSAAPLHLEITGNTLSSFGADAITAQAQAYQEGNELLLGGNVVTGSSPYRAISVEGNYWATSWNEVVVRDNRLSTDQAVTLLGMNYVRKGIVTGNVTSGGTYGIQCALTPGDASHQSVISGNQTSGATEAGCFISCTDYTGTNLPVVVRVEDNSFINNGGVGLRLASNRISTLRRNNLYGNGGFALSNQGTSGAGSAVDATGNYWGATTTSEMQSQGCEANIGAIEDQRDNGSYGLVTYCDWATSTFGDQATITFSGTPAARTITWAPKYGITYDLVRGDRANLSLSGGVVHLGAVTCQAQADGSGSISDTSGNPPAETCWFYLLREHAPTVGAYGYSSANQPDVPDSGGCP